MEASHRVARTARPEFKRGERPENEPLIFKKGC